MATSGPYRGPKPFSSNPITSLSRMYHGPEETDQRPRLASLPNHGNITLLWYIVGTPHRAARLE